MWLWGTAHLLRTPCHPVLPFCRKELAAIQQHSQRIHNLKKQNPQKSVTVLISKWSSQLKKKKKSLHSPNCRVFFYCLFKRFDSDGIFSLFPTINKSTWFPTPQYVLWSYILTFVSNHLSQVKRNFSVYPFGNFQLTFTPEEVLVHTLFPNTLRACVKTQ